MIISFLFVYKIVICTYVHMIPSITVNKKIQYFNVFNADKKVITDFGKIELQVYAQSLWFLTTVKHGIMTLVAIQQIDITLCKIVYSEIAIAIVIYNVLKNKHFVKNELEDDINLTGS